MRILNKLVSVVLCLVLLSNIAITALAEEPTNNVKDLITYCVPVISNEYTDKTVVFYEYQGKYYLDIEDIKNFTRSTVSETDSKIVITHGIRELEIDKSTGHLIDSTVYDQGTIPFLAYEGKYLCEGIPMLMYLGAACTIRDEVALEVLMPSITIWESIMPDYLDYYFNITELYGGEDNVKISLICDILSDVLDGVSGHGLFADGDTHLEDALFEILEVDMMKYTSVREAVATKNQDINDFLSSDAVGTLLEGGSNATDTVSEVLDYYSDFYLETEILKNNIRWQHSYNVGDIDSASKLSKQINSQVYEQSSIKANLGTYENLADVLDLGMIAFDTAVTSYGLMQYDNDIKNLFARTINDEMFNYVGYNEISWTNVSNRISNKLSSNEAIVASTAVENLTEYVAGELVEGGTVQALSAFTSKANIYVAAAQIATFVSSLINKDLHEAYSADMNAIWLSAVQYDIARLTTQVLLKAGEEEKFSNVASIEKLKDMLALYYRTTIAFSENIAVSIDEFGNKNKDEWVKYFSSTTDASVANYAAQYLYRITNCTIVPIIKYMGLNDNLLNGEWVKNYKSTNTNFSDILLNNLWYNEIQAFNEYRFFEDGTLIENPGDFQRTLSYAINGNYLTITWAPGITTNLKYVSKKDNYNWDADLFFYNTVYNTLEENEHFFYQVDWVDSGGPSDNVMWLRKQKDALNVCGDNLTWNLTDSGEFIICGKGEMYSYLDSLPPWHNIKDSIKKVTIEQGVTSIGDCAFFYCEKLQQVNISQSVTSIGVSAFSGTIISDITIPENVNIIGSSAFQDCKELNKITILNSNCTIENAEASSISNTATICSYEKSTAQWYADEFNRPFVALENNAKDGNVPENIKELVLKIFKHKHPNLGGTLVIFDDEIIETNTHYFVTVRIQLDDANANSGANQLFADTTIDKSTGKMYINNEYIDKLW